MPDNTPKAEAKLQKLGKALRSAWKKAHPISERSRETVRSAVREQWEKEQRADREKKSAPGTKKNRGRRPSEPDQGR